MKLCIVSYFFKKLLFLSSGYFHFRIIRHLGKIISGFAFNVFYFGKIDYEAWHKAFQINAMAPLRMAEAFLAQISNSQLKIIAIITSKMGSIDDNKRGGSYIYRSSKAAVNMVGKSLSVDLKLQGITTVILHPGWVKTDMGGPDALISPEQSVLGMQRILSNLKLSDSGKFFAYDGKIIPW